METAILQFGNAKGIPIPQQLLLKYGFSGNVFLTELENGILIEKKKDNKLSWVETYKAMANSDEDWSDWVDMDIGELGNED